MAGEAREFTTVARSAESTAVIKGSQFISRCARAESAREALAFIEAIRARHTDATHNCWAYRISPHEYRFNDDGEPGGSAGQPILQAIISSHLEQVVIVVTRYYGGVKLGVGGLARAYSGGAAAVLKAAGTELVRPRLCLQLEVGYGEQSACYRFFETHPELTVESIEYTATGLTVVVSIYQADRERLTSELTDTLRGRVQIAEKL